MIKAVPSEDAIDRISVSAWSADYFIPDRADTTIAFQSDEDWLYIVDGDGNQIPIFSADRADIIAPIVAPNEQSAIFHHDGKAYIVDITQQVIFDLCDFRGYGFVWSPDSRYIAYSYDGYPVLVNIETLEMQILRYKTDELIAWYPTY